MDRPFPAYKGDDPYVFVCYAHDDEDVVFPEMAWLHEQGINLWYDEGISAGRIWREEIGDAIKGASKVLYYISESSVASEHCDREINYALDHTSVLPVYLEEIALTTDLEVGLGRVQALHRTTDEDYQGHLLGALGQTAEVTRPLPRSRQRVRLQRDVLIGVMAVLFIVALLIWLIPNPPTSPYATESQFVDINPKSIAVLPFVNMSGDEDNTYFSHGISEELLNVLARIPDLKVSSRTSSFHFAASDVPLMEIATKLAVRHILEGSVRRVGNDVRITAQLIDAKTDTHLWSETYDREVLDSFAVQGEIAAAIVGQLQLNLVVPIRSGRPTENEEAFDKYLRGWHFMRQGWSRDDFLGARKYFAEAVELDPEFAQAHALLSLTETSLGNFRHLAPKDVFPSAYASASIAVALDDSSPEAHIAMGWLALSYQFDWEEAAKEFRRAIELAPSNFIGYNGLSYALQAGGRLDEALAASERVFELDPMMVWSRNGRAEIYFKKQEYDAGLKQVLVMLEMQPNDPLILAWVGSFYAAKGMSAEALEYGRQAARVAAGDPNIDLMLARQHAQLGNEAKARKLLEQAIAQRDLKYVSPGTIAIVYTHLGEYDKAIDWLYVAVDEFDSFIFNLNYPDFDALRSKPRFIELCVQLRMPCAEKWDDR